MIKNIFSIARACQKAKQKQEQSQIALTILLYAKITGLLQRTTKQRIPAQEWGMQSQIFIQGVQNRFGRFLQLLER